MWEEEREIFYVRESIVCFAYPEKQSGDQKVEV